MRRSRETRLRRRLGHLPGAAALEKGVVAVAVLLLVPAGARATVLDLSGRAGSIRADGEAQGGEAGIRVAGAGDVNGDGKPDFIVGAPIVGNNGREQSGSAYVVYGGQNLARVDLANLGPAGFRIDGAAVNDGAGFSVAGGADVNGDGVADLIVGAHQASAAGRQLSGAAYVIYGQRVPDPPDIDLANITTTQGGRGFRIDGAAAYDSAGTSVALADVNGDGLADAIIGAPTDGSFNSRLSSGSVYVVYGQRTTDLPDVDLASLAGMTTQSGTGFRIDGAAAQDNAGTAVAGAGDLNGDGVGDLILGAPFADAAQRLDAGSAYVIYGQRGTSRSAIELGNITGTEASSGLRIDGAISTDHAGMAVASAGDLNGDGIDDVLVGAPSASTSAGAAYVIYGQRTPDPSDVDLAAITTAQKARGLAIDGAAANSFVGLSVAGGRDLNGDGRPDAVIGAPGASSNGRQRSGSVYLINGQVRADPADVNLADITASSASSDGLRIDGATENNLAGYAAAAAGDVNDDGHPDLILGAPGFTGTGGLASGAAYVLDLAAPDTAIDTTPALTNDSTPTFTFHATEPASFQCSIDSGRPSFAPCSGRGGSHTPARLLADGTYTFRVMAVDRFGNADPTPATSRFTVDTTAPNTKITAHPRKTLTLQRQRRNLKVTFKFVASQPGAHFRCRLDTKPYRACRSPVFLTLGRGRHVFSVVAIDPATNVDRTPASFALVVKAPPRPNRVSQLLRSAAES